MALVSATSLRKETSPSSGSSPSRLSTSITPRRVPSSKAIDTAATDLISEARRHVRPIAQRRNLFRVVEQLAFSRG
jgi:hypothetical protein